MKNNNFSFNFVIAIFIVFALFSLYWLSRLGLEAGNAYLMLIVVGLVMLIITLIAKFGAKLDFWFEIPINKTAEGGVLSLFLGIATLLILRLASSLSGANFYSPATMAPLASFGTGIGEQTFAALSAATSPFWQFCIIVICAAVIEEIVLGFCFVKMGSLLGYSIRKMLKLDFGDGGGEHSGNYIWDFIIAMIFSLTCFAILHAFNSTYIDPATGKMIWSMFVWAASFRLILNVLIYKFGNLGLLYSMGVHAVNNALYLGGAVVLTALLTFPGGFIISASLILLLYFAVVSFKKIIKEGEFLAKDFLSFD